MGGSRPTVEARLVPHGCSGPGALRHIPKLENAFQGQPLSNRKVQSTPKTPRGSTDGNTDLSKGNSPERVFLLPTQSSLASSLFTGLHLHGALLPKPILSAPCALLNFCISSGVKQEINTNTRPEPISLPSASSQSSSLALSSGLSSTSGIFSSRPASLSTMAKVVLHLGSIG